MSMFGYLRKKTVQGISFAGKVLKTDLMYITKGGFWLTFGQFVSSVSSLLLAIAFANLLPKEVYGTYKYVLSIAGFLSITTLNGMNSALVQAVARGYEGSIIPALKLKMKWGLVGSLIALVLAAYYFINGNPTLTASFVVLAIFCPMMDPFDIYNYYLQGKKDFQASTKFKSASQIVSIVCLIVTIFFTQNILYVLLAYFVSWTLMRYIFLKITLKKFPPNDGVDPATMHYGKHLSFLSLINTTASYLDRVLVFHFLGATDLAVYSIAIAPPEQLRAVLGNLDNLTAPKFAVRDVASIKKEIKHKFLVLFIFTAAVILAYILVAPFIFEIFFKQYKESALLFSQIFALSMLNNTFFPAGAVLRAKLRVKEQYINNVVSSIFQIVSMTVLIIWFGLLGLVIARVISRFFATGLNVILFYRAFPDTEPSDPQSGVAN